MWKYYVIKPFLSLRLVWRCCCCRLLKGYYQEVDISLCFLPLISVPVPNQLLLWPSLFLFFLCFSICALFMCIIILYVVHGQYWGRTQAGCSITSPLLWMDWWRDHVFWQSSCGFQKESMMWGKNINIKTSCVCFVRGTSSTCYSEQHLFFHVKRATVPVSYVL